MGIGASLDSGVLAYLECFKRSPPCPPPPPTLRGWWYPDHREHVYSFGRTVGLLDRYHGGLPEPGRLPRQLHSSSDPGFKSTAPAPVHCMNPTSPIFPASTGQVVKMVLELGSGLLHNAHPRG